MKRKSRSQSQYKRGELNELKKLIGDACDKKNPKANYRKFNFGRKA
jgi:hypothetical protein